MNRVDGCRGNVAVVHPSRSRISLVVHLFRRKEAPADGLPDVPRVLADLDLSARGVVYPDPEHLHHHRPVLGPDRLRRHANRGARRESGIRKLKLRAMVKLRSEKPNMGLRILQEVNEEPDAEARGAR